MYNYEKYDELLKPNYYALLLMIHKSEFKVDEALKLMGIAPVRKDKKAVS